MLNNKLLLISYVRDNHMLLLAATNHFLLKIIDYLLEIGIGRITSFITSFIAVMINTNYYILSIVYEYGKG
jgi:hypothetical protein